MSNLMKLSVALVAVVVVVGGYLFLTQPPEGGMEAARATVEQFGGVLKNVSLAAPAADIATQIEEQYKPFVSGALLTTWKRDPTKAPGRLTSSPWPDRIAVYEVEQSGRGAYTVRGNIIEVTSDTKTPPQSYVITAKVQWQNGAWKITEFSGGPAR